MKYYTTNKLIFKELKLSILTYDLKLKDYILINSYENNNYIGYELKLIITHLKCRHCNQEVRRFKGYRETYPMMDTINNKSVILKCKKKIFYCINCNKSTVQSVEKVKFKQRISTNIKDNIIMQLKNKFTYTDTAKLNNISVNTVINEFDKYNIKYKRYTKIKHLLIDELKLISTIKKFQFVAIDADSGEIIDILEDRDYLTVFSYLMKNFYIGDLETITMDMWYPYKKAINKFNMSCNKDIKIIEKIHFVRHVMHDLDEVRIYEYENKKLSPAQRLLIKGTMKILRQSYNKLNLKAKYRLQEAFNISPNLYVAHQFKEQYLNIVRSSKSSNEFIIELRDWISILNDSNIKGFSRSYSSHSNWLKGIALAFDYNYSNGLIEGTNQKMKLAKNKAFGFTNVKRTIKLMKFTIGKRDFV